MRKIGIRLNLVCLLAGAVLLCLGTNPYIGLGTAFLAIYVKNKTEWKR